MPCQAHVSAEFTADMPSIWRASGRGMATCGVKTHALVSCLLTLNQHIRGKDGRRMPSQAHVSPEFTAAMPKHLATAG